VCYDAAVGSEILKNHSTGGARLALDPSEWGARRGYIPGLDGLRALSISIVLAGHFFLGRFQGFSSLGVYIFFVISGFLITRLLLAECKETGTVSATKFYFRRLLRLYPVLIAFVLVVSLIAATRGLAVPRVEIGAVFLYFTNYLESWREAHGLTGTLPIGLLWSLAVEEHFYIFAPFVVIAVRGDPRKVAIFAAVMCVLPALVRGAYLLIWPDFLGTNIIYRLSETRFDSIAFGVLLAALCEFRRDVIRFLSSYPALLVGLVLLAVSFVIRDPVFKDTLRYTMRSAGAVPLVAVVVFGRMPTLQRIANWSFAVWIGRLSYSLYIWHGAITYIVRPLPVPGLIYGAVLAAGSLILAVASYYLIERPVARLRHQPLLVSNTAIADPTR
jgi:peptidoglycan/LPS O-acetylase OafA/YrhL